MSQSWRYNLPNAQVIKVHFVYIVPSKENKGPSPLYHLVASSATIVSTTSPSAGIGVFKYLFPSTPLTIDIFLIILLHLNVTTRECINDVLEVKPFSLERANSVYFLRIVGSISSCMHQFFLKFASSCYIQIPVVCRALTRRAT